MYFPARPLIKSDGSGAWGCSSVQSSNLFFGGVEALCSVLPKPLKGLLSWNQLWMWIITNYMPRPQHQEEDGLGRSLGRWEIVGLIMVLMSAELFVMLDAWKQDAAVNLQPNANSTGLSIWQVLCFGGAGKVLPKAGVKVVWFKWSVQIFATQKHIKLMKLQRQKISREMNCTTKVRSICTDQSMKNSGVHDWGHCACNDEQVNCPFCLLWEIPETNFPMTHIPALFAGGEYSMKN